MQHHGLAELTAQVHTVGRICAGQTQLEDERFRGLDDRPAVVAHHLLDLRSPGRGSRLVLVDEFRLLGVRGGIQLILDGPFKLVTGIRHRHGQVPHVSTVGVAVRVALGLPDGVLVGASLDVGELIEGHHAGADDGLGPGTIRHDGRLFGIAGQVAAARDHFGGRQHELKRVVLVVGRRRLAGDGLLRLRRVGRGIRRVGVDELRLFGRGLVAADQSVIVALHGQRAFVVRDDHGQLPLVEAVFVVRVAAGLLLDLEDVGASLGELDVSEGGHTAVDDINRRVRRQGRAAVGAAHLGQFEGEGLQLVVVARLAIHGLVRLRRILGRVRRVVVGEYRLGNRRYLVGRGVDVLRRTRNERTAVIGYDDLHLPLGRIVGNMRGGTLDLLDQEVVGAGLREADRVERRGRAIRAASFNSGAADRDLSSIGQLVAVLVGDLTVESAELEGEYRVRSIEQRLTGQLLSHLELSARRGRLVLVGEGRARKPLLGARLLVLGGCHKLAAVVNHGHHDIPALGIVGVAALVTQRFGEGVGVGTGLREVDRSGRAGRQHEVERILIHRGRGVHDDGRAVIGLVSGVGQRHGEGLLLVLIAIVAFDHLDGVGRVVGRRHVVLVGDGGNLEDGSGAFRGDVRAIDRELADRQLAVHVRDHDLDVLGRGVVGVASLAAVSLHEGELVGANLGELDELEVASGVAGHGDRLERARRKAAALRRVRALGGQSELEVLLSARTRIAGHGLLHAHGHAGFGLRVGVHHFDLADRVVRRRIDDLSRANNLGNRQLAVDILDVNLDGLRSSVVGPAGLAAVGLLQLEVVLARRSEVDGGEALDLIALHGHGGRSSHAAAAAVAAIRRQGEGELGIVIRRNRAGDRLLHLEDEGSRLGVVGVVELGVHKRSIVSRSHNAQLVRALHGAHGHLNDVLGRIVGDAVQRAAGLSDAIVVIAHLSLGVVVGLVEVDIAVHVVGRGDPRTGGRRELAFGVNGALFQDEGELTGLQRTARQDLAGSRRPVALRVILVRERVLRVGGGRGHDQLAIGRVALADGHGHGLRRGDGQAIVRVAVSVGVRSLLVLLTDGVGMRAHVLQRVLDRIAVQRHRAVRRVLAAEQDLFFSVHSLNDFELELLGIQRAAGEHLGDRRLPRASGVVGVGELSVGLVVVRHAVGGGRHQLVGRGIPGHHDSRRDHGRVIGDSVAGAVGAGLLLDGEDVGAFAIERDRLEAGLLGGSAVGGGDIGDLNRFDRVLRNQFGVERLQRVGETLVSQLEVELEVERLLGEAVEQLLDVQHHIHLARISHGDLVQRIDLGLAGQLEDKLAVAQISDLGARTVGRGSSRAFDGVAVRRSHFLDDVLGEPVQAGDKQLPAGAGRQLGNGTLVIQDIAHSAILGGDFPELQGRLLLLSGVGSVTLRERAIDFKLGAACGYACVVLGHLGQLQLTQEAEADILGLVNLLGVAQVERPGEVFASRGFAEVVVQCVLRLFVRATRGHSVRVVGHVVAIAQRRQLNDVKQASGVGNRRGDEVVVGILGGLQGSEVQLAVDALIGVQAERLLVVGGEQIQEAEMLDGLANRRIIAMLVRSRILDRIAVFGCGEADAVLQQRDDVEAIIAVAIMLLDAGPIFVDPQVAFHLHQAIHQSHVDKVGLQRIIVKLGGVEVIPVRGILERSRPVVEFVFLRNVLGRSREGDDEG